MKRPGGSFFESISAPGAGKLAQDRTIGNPNSRTKIKLTAADSTEKIPDATGPHAYEVSFRSGGGMAIAALALASSPCRWTATFPGRRIYAPRKNAFDFLDAHNRPSSTATAWKTFWTTIAH